MQSLTELYLYVAVLLTGFEIWTGSLGSVIAAAGNQKRMQNHRPKHVEQLRNIGIINSTARLHLVSSFYEIEKRFPREFW